MEQTVNDIIMNREAAGDFMPGEAADVAEERRLRKQRLAATLRIFGKFGFDEGLAGHVTVRDPEHTDHFWVNPFGRSFKQMKVSDLLLVNHKGEVVEGKGLLNGAAFTIHSRIHMALPEVTAAAHTHSLYGKAWSSLGRLLDPITQDACAFYEDHVVIAEQGAAVVFEEEAGREFAAKFPSGKAAIHQNHGLFTVGTTVDEACFWFCTMERNCQAQLMAMAAGEPIEIRHEYARYTAEQTGSHQVGWFQFQPLWDEICRTDPDLFD